MRAASPARHSRAAAPRPPRARACWRAQPWGLSKKEAREAEIINGRLAMAALALLVSQGVIVDRFFPNLIATTLSDTVSQTFGI